MDRCWKKIERWAPALAGAWLGCTSTTPIASTTDAAAPPPAVAPSEVAGAAPEVPPSGSTVTPAPPTDTASAAQAAPAAPPADARLPPHWTARVKLKSVADVAAARSEDVLKGGDSLSLGHYPETDKRSARTCLEYDAAVADGFSADTTPDIAQESFFKARCYPLRFLAGAWPSATTWVSALRLDKDPLAVLPATMNIAMEGPSDAEKEAFARGQRLKAFSPDLVVTASSPVSVTFGHPKTFTSTVDVMAYGDVDHDGVEDVLLFQSMHSLEGSFRGFRAFVATRKGPSEPLMTVRELDRR